MESFRFCPRCSSELDPQDDQGAARCSNCARAWYRNAAPTAGCVIVRDGRALVTVRASEPEKGRIDIPGGFLQPTEDPIEGLRREIREELSVEIDVDISDCVQMVPHPYGDDGDWVLALGFRARLASGEPVAGDDVERFLWVGPQEVDELDWAWDHDRRLVETVLKGSNG